MYYYFTDKFILQMRNCININVNNIPFKYLLDYTKSNTNTIIDSNSIKFYKTNSDIKLLMPDIEYYRDNNDWYSINNLVASRSTFIPENIKLTNIKIYIPNYSVSTYIKNIKYAVSLHTWISGIKIDFGTYIFSPTDTYAIPNGCIKDGNNEYYECIDFDIIDPFYLIYSDEWDEFRKKECLEFRDTNNNVSTIIASLYVVEEYDNSYIVKTDIIGGYTTFSISDDTSDHLELKLSLSHEPLGFKFDILMNEVYNNFLNYLSETYGLDSPSIYLELVIKDKENIIIDDLTKFLLSINTSEFGKLTQQLLWNSNSTNLIIPDNSLIKSFFNDWNNYSEGWSFAGSITIYKDDIEVLSFVSNEIPITQEVFSIFTRGGSEKIIDINDMNITTYNIINKIENKITTIERPNESKSNILQPVFFRAKDTEVLTLHPAVTENISINLDNYKSKVEKFTLKIGNTYFSQIGSNSYGILFKITANSLPQTESTGIYYILDDNKELVTTGKYNTVI